MKKIIIVLVMLITFLSIGFVNSGHYKEWNYRRHNDTNTYVTIVNAEEDANIIKVGYDFSNSEKSSNEKKLTWEMDLEMDYLGEIVLDITSDLVGKEGLLYVVTEDEQKHETTLTLVKNNNSMLIFRNIGEGKKLYTVLENGINVGGIKEIKIENNSPYTIYYSNYNISEEERIRKNEFYSLNDMFTYRLRDNTLYGSVITSFKIPYIFSNCELEIDLYLQDIEENPIHNEDNKTIFNFDKDKDYKVVVDKDGKLSVEEI